MLNPKRSEEYDRIPVCALYDGYSGQNQLQSLIARATDENCYVISKLTVGWSIL